VTRLDESRLGATLRRSGDLFVHALRATPQVKVSHRSGTRRRPCGTLPFGGSPLRPTAVGAPRTAVGIFERAYETGRTYAKGFKKTMRIVFDKFLPKWNYRAIPEPA